MSKRQLGKAQRFQTRHLEWLRGQCQRAIARSNLGPTARLLHMVTTFVDARGATWRGARSLSESLEFSETWVRMLFARACAEGQLQQIQRGGGRHRTSVYLLKIGPWRDNYDDPKMQATFADRRSATLYAYEDWLNGLFLAHHQHEASCWQYAPARLKPSP